MCLGVVGPVQAIRKGLVGVAVIFLLFLFSLF